VAEVAEQPPEPLGAAHVPVGDDEDAVADPGARCGGRKRLLAGKRMATARTGRRGEVGVHVEERRARDVAGEIELAGARRVADVPAAIDELVPHPEINTCFRPETHLR
jgi:hypothetical protein